MMKLRAAVQATDWQILGAKTWSEFELAARDATCLLVVDPPLRSGGSPIRQLTDQARAFMVDSAAGTILYTSATKVAACVAIQRIGPLRVVIEGIDDNPAAFRFQLAEVRADGLAQTVGTAIRSAATTLDPRMLAVIGHLVETDMTVSSVVDLARIFDMSRTAFYRYVTNAGIRSPLAVLQVLKVARLYKLLAVQHVDVRTALHLLGEQDGRSWRRAVVAVLGNPNLRELRSHPASEIGHRCVASLVER